MTHTKAPWHVGQGNGEGSIFADEGRMRMTDKGTTLYPICTINTGWDESEDAANARLVAAAPELLEALVAFRDASGGNFTGWHQKYEKAVGLARAALAKVTPT